MFEWYKNLDIRDRGIFQLGLIIIGIFILWLGIVIYMLISSNP